MFKVESSAEAKEIGHWEIKHTDSDKVVAVISTFHGFRKEIKQLKVKDKIVCDIKNQKEALVKLENFFERIKRDIESNKILHEHLTRDINLVRSTHSVDVLFKESQRLEKVIEDLEQYNLI